MCSLGIYKQTMTNVDNCRFHRNTKDLFFWIFKKAVLLMNNFYGTKVHFKEISWYFRRDSVFFITAVLVLRKVCTWRVLLRALSWRKKSKKIFWVDWETTPERRVWIRRCYLWIWMSSSIRILQISHVDSCEATSALWWSKYVRTCVVYLRVCLLQDDMSFFNFQIDHGVA